MKYVTVATAGAYRAPPGADHTTKFQEYIPTPGRMWKCVSPEDGEWTVGEMGEEEIKARKLRSTWCIGTIERRAVVFYEAKDGTRYAQPIEEDPRAKDKELGSGKKRSRFMAKLKQARAEEAARQGKTVAVEPVKARSKGPKVRKPKPLVLMFEDC